jgi:hypothetical protein
MPFFLVLKICFTNMPYRFSSGVFFFFFSVLKYILQTCPIDFPAVFSFLFFSVLLNIPQMIFKNSEKNSGTILKLFMNPSHVSQPFHLILDCKFIL